MRRRFLTWLALALALLPVSETVMATVSAADIEALARQHASAAAERAGLTNVQITVQRLDERLRQPDCAGTLEVLDEGAGLKAGRMVLRIGCSSPSSWSVYLPVQLAYDVPVYRFRRSMQVGEVLSAGDLVQDHVPAHALPPQAVTDPLSYAGMVLARGVGAGTLVDAGALRQRPVVDQGQQVTIRAQRSGLQISMDGVALQSGVNGALIQVKNLSSGKALQARIVGPGLVEVGP